MSQFPQPGYYDPNMMMTDQPAKRSGLAVTALVMSLIGIVPCLGALTAPIGVLLGAIGLVTIHPPRKGKGMAASALVIGVLLTAGQAFMLKKGYDFFYGFIAFVMNGPNDALTMGANGDFAGFRAQFHGAGATATDAEVQAFFDQLTQRYGTFVSAKFDENSGKKPATQPGQPSVPMPYVLVFANGTVKAEVELIFADPQGGGFVKKLGYITVFDAQAGDITFPSSAAGTGGTGPTGAPAATGDAGATGPAADGAIDGATGDTSG